ncbi:hypothetical protein AXFE_35400 [Acidithrix ferrooxidans]|uniref:Uncharacterized protein n=1 Tax=Acidithrix ferrooxidans TaxID=1280514 RepID=A0A0D8HEX5_9ACTN|nr:hypothetical protein AXFE_35400 [Acidithrix ferrooxidans]
MPAFRVIVPVRFRVELLYAPGVNVTPPKVPAATVVALWLAAMPYAAVAAVCAASDAELLALVVPVSVPGGKPVIDVPGDSPISPLMTDDPVLVIVEPATTAYDVAEPRLRAVAANAGLLVEAVKTAKPKMLTPSAVSLA